MTLTTVIRSDLNHRHFHIGPAHILLGLLEARDGSVAGVVLKKLGIDENLLHERVVALLTETSARI